MKRIILVLLLPASLFCSEPSAFGAGNLESASPYGLTESEKHILKNKKHLESIKKETRAQDGKVESIRERMDGLQTIVEGLSVKAHQNSVSIENIANEVGSNSETSLRTLVKNNSEEIVKLKEALKDFSELIDIINNNYITKDDYNALIDEINDLKVSLAKSLKTSSKETNTLDNMSSADVAAKAQAFFDKKYYTNAITYYEHLIKKNYKPAAAHYMIGEMNFRRNKYKKALSYFKESASLYDKADYMPTLMLHSAMAMEKMGDHDNAQLFYQGVIGKFPGTNEAKEAEKRVK